MRDGVFKNITPSVKQLFTFFKSFSRFGEGI